MLVQLKGWFFQDGLKGNNGPVVKEFWEFGREMTIRNFGIVGLD